MKPLSLGATNRALSVPQKPREAEGLTHAARLSPPPLTRPGLVGGLLAQAVQVGGACALQRRTLWARPGPRPNAHSGDNGGGGAGVPGRPASMGLGLNYTVAAAQVYPLQRRPAQVRR